MNAIFGDQVYRGYIHTEKISKLNSAVIFENVFFTILPGHILCMEYLFEH